MMKTRFSLVVMALLTLAFVLPESVLAAGPPRVSPSATVSQTVGLAEVSITYSRPAMRGREIFGELVPYGEVWRTGANEATTITLSHDAEVGGKAVAAGTYALFTIPGPESWTVILNKQANQWGAFRHDPAQDALRVEAKVTAAPYTELLTASFTEVSSNAATVELAWAESRASFEIAFDTHAIAQEVARKEVEVADGAEPGTTWTWADYFYQQGIDNAQAMKWANRAVEEQESYWAVALQARLLARTGKAAEAVVAAKKALQLGAAALEERPNARLQADLEQLTEELGAWTAAAG